jgi:hypothetical protein
MPARLPAGRAGSNEEPEIRSLAACGAASGGCDSKPAAATRAAAIAWRVGAGKDRGGGGGDAPHRRHYPGDDTEHGADPDARQWRLSKGGRADRVPDPQGEVPTPWWRAYRPLGLCPFPLLRGPVASWCNRGHFQETGYMTDRLAYDPDAICRRICEGDTVGGADQMAG